MLLLIQDVSERKIRFTSNHSAKELLERIEDIVTDMGFCIQKKNGRVSVNLFIYLFNFWFLLHTNIHKKSKDLKAAESTCQYWQTYLKQKWDFCNQRHYWHCFCLSIVRSVESDARTQGAQKSRLSLRHSRGILFSLLSISIQWMYFLFFFWLAFQLFCSYSLQ